MLLLASCLIFLKTILQSSAYSLACLTYPLLVSSVSAGILSIIISPLLLGVKPIFASYIPFSIALIEETRRGYVKQAKEYAEDCKIVLRNIRQDANNNIKKLELPEDDVKAGQEDVQELINKFNKVVEEKLKVKETELMTV